MSFPIKQLELDPWGNDPDNFIQGEEHILPISKGMYHAVAPYLGPFYNDPTTWKVYKNGVQLKYNKDFFGIVMCGDQTMQFNGEIDEIILIKGASEGDKITIDLQYLGGIYQNHSKGIADMWQAFIHDDRPIDWVNVLGKPISWNPSYHLHMIDDVVGWQHVVISLERMTNAIVLSNIPAFEELIEWVLKRIPDIVSAQEVLDMTQSEKLVNFKRLLFSAQTLNFNAVKLRPKKRVVNRGGIIGVDVSSTNFPRLTTLFWDVLHETTTPEMFSRSSGSFQNDNNEGIFYALTNPDYAGKDEKTFRLQIRLSGPTGPVIAETPRLILRYNNVWDWDYGLLDNGVWDLVSSDQSILTYQSPEAAYLVPGAQFWQAAAIS